MQWLSKVSKNRLIAVNCISDYANFWTWISPKISSLTMIPTRVVFKWLLKVMTWLISDWLNYLTQLFQPMRSKTKSNGTFLRALFPSLWLSYRQFLRILIGSLRCWLPMWLVGVKIWFWFDSHDLKTALRCITRSCDNLFHTSHQVLIAGAQSHVCSSNLVQYFVFYVDPVGADGQ